MLCCRKTRLHRSWDDVSGTDTDGELSFVLLPMRLAFEVAVISHKVERDLAKSLLQSVYDRLLFALSSIPVTHHLHFWFSVLSPRVLL